MSQPATPSRTGSRAPFMVVFIAVFLLVEISATLITFILPEVYASTARVKLMKPAAADSAATTNFVSDPYFIQTELEVLRTEAILNPVIERLNLNLVWGHRFGGNTKLPTENCRAILDRMLELHAVPKSDVVEICVHDQDRDEAAYLANAIAESYIGYHLRQVKNQPGMTSDPLAINDPPVLLVDKAEPGLRPVRPNKPLNIGLGALYGIIFGTIAGGLVQWLASRSRR